MIKEVNLEHKEGERNNRKSRNIGNTIDYSFSHELYKSYLMIETKIITPSDTQDNGI